MTFCTRPEDWNSLMKNSIPCSVAECGWGAHTDTGKCHLHSLGLMGFKQPEQRMEENTPIYITEPVPFAQAKLVCPYCIMGETHP